MVSTLSRRPTGRMWLFLGLALALALAFVVALGTPSKVEAADVTAEVYLLDSNGNGIQGGRIMYGSPNGGWNTLDYTDADGRVVGTVPSNSYLGAAYNQGSIFTSGPVDFSEPYTFTTTKVTLLHPAPITFAKNENSGWVTFNSPMELLPGGYLVRSGGNEFPITVGDTNIIGGLLRLIDSNGNGLEGGMWSYYHANGWHPGSGPTDANGNVFMTLPSSSSSITVKMSYAGTGQQLTVGQLTAVNFTFQTAKVTVNLKDADGNPLDTGTVGYYANGWRTFGTGQTSGGSVSQELLPTSTISVKMTYNHSSMQKDNIHIVGPATTVDFQTGRLSIHFSGGITWYVTPNYYSFSNGMEFLPGNITFYLSASSGCGVTIPIASGDKLVKSAIVATLRNGAMQPIPGASASVYAGSWQSLGTTNSQGRVCAVVNGTLGNAAVKMSYAGTSQTITQHQPTNSYYSFTASLVTIELRDSGGALMDTGSASYYAGGWYSLGNTSSGKVVTPMLPGSYSIAMVYNGTRQQLNSQVISGTTSVVTFQTSNVTVNLIDSGESGLDGGAATYYAGSWRTIGETSNGMVSVEMLPGSYAFAMVYEGTRQQLNAQPVSGLSSEVTFQTSNVTVKLVDSEEAGLAGGAATYYAGSWRTIGETNDDGEISVELLPGSYAFAMVYKGTRQQLNAQPISGLASDVTFQTGTVTSSSGSATGYYASGWKSFTNGMDLLPGTYTFKYSDGPNQAVTIVAGTDTSIN